MKMTWLCVLALVLFGTARVHGQSAVIKEKALAASLSALAAKNVGFGTNPFKQNPMTVGLAGQHEDSAWIVVDDAWEYQTEYAKNEYINKVFDAFIEAGCVFVKRADGSEYRQGSCGYDISALTIRKYSTGKELAYCEKPCETRYFQETWMGLEGGPNDPRPKLPKGLSWAPLH
ncbi:MAG: hypothetical protein WC859_00810 [Elusimicrobiota bacterium]|jgi:hypothetical protein